MHIINIFLLVSSSLFASTDSVLSSNEELENKQNFIEGLESDDPEVQREISRLKKDYSNAKDQIRNKYADKRKQLKIQKDQEMQVLTNSFQNRLEKIRNMHPQKIRRTMRTKPLNKKNMDNYKNSGKIYVSNFGKINQTLLSISDLIKLLFTKQGEHLTKNEHSIINEQINLNERI